MYIDTHAHLNFEDYKDDIGDVIQRSLDNKVEKIICVSSNIRDSLEAIEVSKKYPENVFAAVGIHPQSTDPENKDLVLDQLKKLEDLIKNNKVVAIGECGLDNTEPPPEERKRSTKEQRELFLGQIELAKKYKLPILIHCNKAYEELYEILVDHEGLVGIFHFYSGGKRRLKKFLEFENFMFGVAGTVTYEEGIQYVVKEIPIERIVLETDCPFLAPEPHRGEQNEPSYIPLIASKISEIKEIPLDEIEKSTTEDTEKIFETK